MPVTKIALKNDTGFLQISQSDGSTCVSLHARKMGQHIKIGTLLSPRSGFLSSFWPFPDYSEVFYAGRANGDPLQRFEVKTGNKAQLIYGNGLPVLKV